MATRLKNWLSTNWFSVVSVVAMFAGLAFAAGAADARLANIEKRVDGQETIKTDVAYIRGQIDSHWGAGKP